MLQEDFAKKIGASIFLLVISSVVLYQSCRRASTIYFFELDTTTVIFMEKTHAVVFPLILSILLFFVYLGTKRSVEIQNERHLEVQGIKSSSNSRKVSREKFPSRKMSICEDFDTQARIKRLLSDIEEEEKYREENGKERENVMQNDESLAPVSNFSPQSVSQKTSRKSSMDKNKLVLSNEDHHETNVYQQFGEIDLFSYSMSVMSLLPGSAENPRIFVKLDFLDIISELFAIHLPIWACVGCIHIIMLESFSQHLSFYFYYHEESMMYSSILLSILFGIFHELYGNWISNDILAFASIYVVCSRIQAVSYQTVVIFVIGMAIFDLFFLYVVDLLSTVTKHNRAPLMIIIPRDTKGHIQSLATLDIMVPGVFLNVILKYSSMYDSSLFIATFSAIFGSLVLTMLFAVWRSKTTPAMVLPAISAIFVSLAGSSHVEDLWKFMIKH